MSLGAGDELLVFASNKDRRVAAGELHTNFKLDSGGEYLALVKPDGTTVEFDYGTSYPPQYADVSYGLSSLSSYTSLRIAPEAPLPMHDDGVAPDAVAGDGIYSASIPLAGLAAGEMLRWRFEAADADGTGSRLPLFNAPINSPEYFGTVALDPSISRVRRDARVS